MDTKKLRQKILDLAIRGKLVPQDPNDEPASVLLERIKAEKEQLIKEGKIKRSKRSAPSDTSPYENVPFQIPESWVWTTVGDIFIHNTGKALNASNNEGVLMDYITTSNLYWDKFDLTVVKQMLFTDAEIEKCTVKYGDLLVCEGGDIGRAAIWTYDYEIRIQNHIHRLRGFCNISHRFYYYILLLYKMLNLIGGKGVAIQGLSSNDLHKLVVPLPPIKEQCRIVSIIELWFSVIDRIEQEKKDLCNVIKQIKFKILDLAIQGKLVPQDPNDEPAIELLRRINPNFKPCDNAHYKRLSEGWTCCLLENVANVLDNKRQPIKTEERKKRVQGKSQIYPYYGATGIAGNIDDYLLEGRYILLGEDGAPFLDKDAYKAYEVNGRFWVNNHAHILKPKIDFLFLLHYLNTIDYADYVKGTTRLKLTQADMNNIKIMLPPLPEQHRIVAKIEELFATLDKIKESLEA